ncbi:AraC family transcriptional regulator [Sinorhizobium meliloti]|uniref:helix-turn-helix domain-containing protein n=1 Tax=Rhizobium meliloti TaxID=382 RepID=UPI003F14DEF5
MLNLQQFGVEQTHGILTQSFVRQRRGSDGRGWNALYASSQHELPFGGEFSAVADELLVWHRNGPANIKGHSGHRGFSQLVPPDGIHLIPGNADFSIELGNELDTLHVYLRRWVIEEVGRDLVSGDPATIQLRPCVTSNDRLLVNMLSAVAEALEDEASTSRLFIDHIARAIACQLVLNYSERAPSKNTPKNEGRAPNARMIRVAIEYMHENIDNSIGLDEIARTTNCSVSHFAREFRSHTGVPPHRYLIQMRVKKACRLLESSNLPIAEIAYECGFTHQEHMTRHFKQIFDTTPAAYRRRRRT